MLHIQTLRSISSSKTHKSQSTIVQSVKAFSSRFAFNSEESLHAAREWFSTFTPSTLPIKLATTTFSKSSGPGGQKTNKTNSKATTVWPLSTLLPLLPEALHEGIRTCRYYAASSQSLVIQCDTHRDQSSNKEETHKRLFEELKKIYDHRIPGISSPEQKKRIEVLKTSENAARLRVKKMHSDKKRSRRKGNDSD